MIFGRPFVGLILVAAVLSVCAPSAAADPTRPVVTAVSPQIVTSGGGTRLAITGSSFADVRAVHFGKTSARAVSVKSRTRLLVTPPAHAAGVVHVRVVTGHGTSPVVAADRVRFVSAPSVTAVTPAIGPPGGGDRVIVHGTQFYGVRAVRFGAHAGTNVHVTGPKTLSVTAPHHAAGRVNVRVVNQNSASPITAADRYIYRDPPAPVTELRADPTQSTVELSWTPSVSSTASRTVIQRDGAVIATLPAATYHYRDDGLAGSTSYAYTVVAQSTPGPQSSTSASVNATTVADPRPAAPTDLTVVYAEGGPPGPCSQASGWLGTSPTQFRLAALVGNPDTPANGVRADFELRDLGASDGDTPVVLIAADDPDGHSTSSATGSNTIVVKDLSSDLLSDGHQYDVDALADDGTERGLPSARCNFGYDSTAPSVRGVTQAPAAARVGQPVTFTVTGTENAPATGTPSGFAHFSYSFGSASQLAGDGGTHVKGTGSGLKRKAKLTLTPTVWGTNYLYIDAHDVAGNTSETYTYSFYVTS